MTHLSDSGSSAGRSRASLARAAWLKYRSQGAEYLPPDYYLKLLKPYIFDGHSDIDLFRGFLASSDLKTTPQILELGPGTGRASEVLIQAVQPAKVTFVDQSHRMLTFLRGRLNAQVRADYVSSDAIDFCQRMNDAYDLVYSLWSISHAVHQSLSLFGIEKGTERVVNGLKRLFAHGLAPGGSLFLLHFDSMSPEQEISLRQRSRLFSFLKCGQKSASQQIIESLLDECEKAGTLLVETQQCSGTPIVYSNMEEALEIFMNFHIEGYLNDSPEVERVLGELEDDLKRHERPDGKISIATGCLVYSCRKLS